MSGNQTALDPKLSAVLARLCQKLGSLTKTQAVKLPYLVDVIANHELGRRITAATYQQWRHGVVAADVWHFAKTPGRVGSFDIEEVPYSEGSVSIRSAVPAPEVLTPAESAIVDFVADQYGALYFDDLGRLTKAMNVEVVTWGSNAAPRLDDEAYARLAGHWADVLKELSSLDTEDQRNWTELTEFSPEALRKSLGV